MTERFAELLAKGKAGGLTPAETEELARLLNAPILDVAAGAAAGFVSKHDFAPSDVAGRLRGIDWFSRRREPPACDLAVEVARVATWADAVERCADEAWENAELEAQNQLTLWLQQHDAAVFQQWNERVFEHKAAVLGPLANEKWMPYLQPRGLDAAVVQCV